MGERQHTAEQKTTMILPNLRGEASLAEFFEDAWDRQAPDTQKAEFLEAGKSRTKSKAGDDEQKQLERTNERLKRLLATRPLLGV